MAVATGFSAGDAPGTPVLSAGRLFIPEVANLAVQETPLTPTPVRPISDRFILTSTAVALGSKVYVNAGSLVKVVNPVLQKTTGSFVVNTGGGGLGTALSLAGSGDGHSLLASYVVLGIDSGPTDGGIVKVDAVSGTQLRLSSFPFVPGALVSSPDGAFAYAVAFTNGDQVGSWNTTNNVFLRSATIAGKPFYVGLGVSHDGAMLYLVDQNGKVDFVNAATLQLVTSVAVGTAPSGIAISADGTQALVTDGRSTSVTVLNLVVPSVIGTIDVGAASSGSVFLN